MNFFGCRSRIADVLGTCEENLLTRHEGSTVILEFDGLPLFGRFGWSRCRSANSLDRNLFCSRLGTSRLGHGGDDLALDALDTDGSNSTTGASLEAGTTKHTSLGVDVGHIVAHMHSIAATSVLALLAGNARTATNLHGIGTLVHVHAGHHKGILRLATHVAHLHDAARTSLGTGTTSRTLGGIHLRNARLGVHVDGIELTGCHTVSTAQTAIGTQGFAHARGVGHTATLHTVVGGDTGTHFTRSVASHHG